MSNYFDKIRGGMSNVKQLSIRKLLMAVLFLCSCFHANARHELDNYTVVISLDGCRWDYPMMYDTPFLDYLSSVGVEAGLIPSFPSKTFPNHYTLATGLYPDHHGLVANTFYDRETGCRFSLGDSTAKMNPRYYGGEPIWITAQRQGLRTAVFYWPGSDVCIKGQFPWRYHVYDQKPRLSFKQRTDGILQMLQLPEEERPALIMAYFEQPDSYGHTYGPHAKQTREAVHEVDDMLRQLYQDILSLPVGPRVNLIILSDHGMTRTDASRLIDLKACVADKWGCRMEGSSPTNIYVEKEYQDSVCAALGKVDHIRFWRHGELPAYLHYGENPRVGDIVVVPDLGWEIDTHLSELGGHGFDPEFDDMHAIFRAIGPDFHRVTLPHFRNVHVYPLLCKLLHIQPAPCDGNLEEIRQMINENE